MALVAPLSGIGATDYSRRSYQDAIREQARRNLESLRLYRPLKFQEAFHASTAKEVILQKGNQVGGPERFDEPVLLANGEWSEIGNLKIGDRIIGGNGQPCMVTGVQDVGVLAIFKVHFDDDVWVRCALSHPWKCQLTKTERFKSHENYKADKWAVRSLIQIIHHGGYEPKPRDRAVIPVCACEFPDLPVALDPYVLGVLLGDGSFANTAVSITTGDPEIAVEVAAGLDDTVNLIDRSRNFLYEIVSQKIPGSPRRNSVMATLRDLGLHGRRGEEKFIPDLYSKNSIRVRLAILQGLMDTDGYANADGATYFYSSSPELAQGIADIARSLGGKARITWRETEIRASKVKKLGRPRLRQADPSLFKNECLNMAVVWIRLPGMCPFRLSRKVERWKRHQQTETTGRVMTKIEPDGNARCVCIQVDSHDHTYVTRDYIVTHNSLCGFVEDARAAMGCDPYNKYPKENGTIVCIGYGEKHIGTVIHKYLFRPGAFRIIRDLLTRQWRTYRPWPTSEVVNGDAGDLDRKDEAREAPPLIPERMIKGQISYDKRSDYIFSQAELVNGWTIKAYNSAGDPHQAQGFQANLVHIDEDTAAPGWYIEMLNRLSMTEGLLRWTALPHMKNDELMGLIERAEDDRGKENPTTVLVKATVFDNPYYPKASREANEKILKAMGEDAYRQRMLGELISSTVDMYPNFSKYLHEAIKLSDPRLPVQKALSENNGQPPVGWCLYAVIDPGHTVCAVTFWCVPPPQIFGDFKICYDELYIKNCDSKILTRHFKHKFQDKLFEEFIIDAHGGRLSGISSGVDPITQYTRDFAEAGITSVKTGSGFRHGSDDITGRVMSLRDWMLVRDDGTTTFLIVTARCPNTVTEFTRFKKKRAMVNGVLVTLDEGERRNVHAVETCEYAAAHGLPYVKPKATSTGKTWLDRVLEQRAAYSARQSEQSSSVIRLGPPA